MNVITLAFEMFHPSHLSRISRPFTLRCNGVNYLPMKLLESNTDGIEFIRETRCYTSEAETKVEGDVSGLNM